jgi:hypothetical protein
MPAHVVWTGSFGLDPQAAINNRNVVIRDGDQNHLTVLGHDLGPARIDVKTTSVVVGFGPSALVLASGRRIGVLAVPS